MQASRQAVQRQSARSAPRAECSRASSSPPEPTGITGRPVRRVLRRSSGNGVGVGHLRPVRPRDPDSPHTAISCRRPNRVGPAPTCSGCCPRADRRANGDDHRCQRGSTWGTALRSGPRLATAWSTSRSAPVSAVARSSEVACSRPDSIRRWVTCCCRSRRGQAYAPTTGTAGRDWLPVPVCKPDPESRAGHRR